MICKSYYINAKASAILSFITMDMDMHPGDSFDSGFCFLLHWVLPLAISGGSFHPPDSGNSWKVESAMVLHPQASLI